jgi:hypothetical protein
MKLPPEAKEIIAQNRKIKQPYYTEKYGREYLYVVAKCLDSNSQVGLANFKDLVNKSESTLRNLYSQANAWLLDIGYDKFERQKFSVTIGTHTYGMQELRRYKIKVRIVDDDLAFDLVDRSLEGASIVKSNLLVKNLVPVLDLNGIKERVREFIHDPTKAGKYVTFEISEPSGIGQILDWLNTQNVPGLQTFVRGETLYIGKEHNE